MIIEIKDILGGDDITSIFDMSIDLIEKYKLKKVSFIFNGVSMTVYKGEIWYEFSKLYHNKLKFGE